MSTLPGDRPEPSSSPRRWTYLVLASAAAVVVMALVVMTWLGSLGNDAVSDALEAELAEQPDGSYAILTFVPSGTIGLVFGTPDTSVRIWYRDSAKSLNLSSPRSGYTDFVASSTDVVIVSLGGRDVRMVEGEGTLRLAWWEQDGERVAITYHGLNERELDPIIAGVEIADGEEWVAFKERS